MNQQPTANNQKHISGFTLVEILVSATIISLLTTIGVQGFAAITRNGRDALRRSDLEQIRSALEIYKSETGSYPDNATGCRPNSLVPDYLKSFPNDPKLPNYDYCYIRLSNLTYKLCANLENGSSPPSPNTYCVDVVATACGSNPCNYQVTNP